MFDFLLWPITTVFGAVGWVGSVALWLAPVWAVGSIIFLPQAVWKRSGRSKWGWLTAATVGLFMPVVGVATAVLYAVGPRSPVKRELADFDALSG